MQNTITRIPFAWTRGNKGEAAIMIVILPDGRKLVACMDVCSNADVPVNLAVVEIAEIVTEKFKIQSDRLVWIEYSEPFTGTDAVGGWERLTLPKEKGARPEWNRLTYEAWKSFGIPPIPQPR